MGRFQPGYLTQSRLLGSVNYFRCDHNLEGSTARRVDQNRLSGQIVQPASGSSVCTKLDRSVTMTVAWYDRQLII